MLLQYLFGMFMVGGIWDVYGILEMGCILVVGVLAMGRFDSNSLKNLFRWMDVVI